MCYIISITIYLKIIKNSMKDYDINSIPRFVLIDKEGKFINANFIRPSSKVFDELMKSYLE